MVDGTYRVEERMTIDAVVRANGEVLGRTWALNEAAVEKRSRERILEVVLEVDGRPVSGFGCDGVLCATPTGSTAYAFSAGGPLVWPQVQALLLVPSNAHALFARPMVISPGQPGGDRGRPDRRRRGAGLRRPAHGRRCRPGRGWSSARATIPVRLVRLRRAAVRRPAGAQVRPAGARLARAARTRLTGCPRVSAHRPFDHVFESDRRVRP